MADYIEPTQRSFDNAESMAADVLSQSSPNLITKIGSVIRELIIRPSAYLMSWSTDNFLNMLAQSSVMYLKTSQETDNPIADMVASNYFVTRLQGTSARGILTPCRTKTDAVACDAVRLPVHSDSGISVWRRYHLCGISL